MAAVLLLYVPVSRAEGADCDWNGRLSGVVQDPTKAVIVRASVTLTTKDKRRVSMMTDSQGTFLFSCLPSGNYTVDVVAEGFGIRRTEIKLAAGENKNIQVELRIATRHEIVTSVPTSHDDDSDPGSMTLNELQLGSLADDPEDFQRELQALAASSGGIPGQATITQDGFSGASRLPPKSAIREIRINPDLFSSEYENPPYQGGRIEIITKPGQAKYHGSVFFSTGGLPFNARDPLGHTIAPANRERYGTDFSGPLHSAQNDFSIHLEYRTLDESKAINTFSLNPQFQVVPFSDDVLSTHSQWTGLMRTDWKVSAKDNLTVSFSTHVNNSSNDGVGGTVLREAGYGTSLGEYSFRISNNDAINVKLLHLTRLGLTWKDLNQVPNSTAPALIVSGGFSGGGAASQRLRQNELDLEFGDSVLLTVKKHSLKSGVVILGKRIDARSNELFNGMFDFGGGVGPVLDEQGNPIPGSSQFLSGLEQYRRTLLGLAGGRPSNFIVGDGNPQVRFTQWRVAGFVQDDWKITDRMALSSGLRYAMETVPSSVGTLAPRLGLAWSPWRRHWMTLRARVGAFYQPIDETVVLREKQLDGSSATQTVLYSPAFATVPDFSSSAAIVQNIRQFADGVHPSRTIETQIGLDANLPAHWKLEASGYWTWGNGILRSVNVNSPFVEDVNTDPFTAPRPIAPAVNIFEYQPSGSLRGPVLFVGINQFFSKRYTLLIGYLNFDMTSDADNSGTFPQSAFSGRGEMARPGWEAKHRVFATQQLTLPGQVSLSSHLETASGLPYNITTGFDNNGDGIINDRPSIASPSDPSGIPTIFGRLTPVTVAGNVARNVGTMPWTVHLDMGLSRHFALHSKAPENSKAITISGRVSNLINHTNVTAVNTILGSPAFGQALTADVGRRIEIGGRYSF